eukprot:scaffold424391_cov17-Prasinocladus_malaysianus.AAC.1
MTIKFPRLLIHLSNELQIPQSANQPVKESSRKNRCGRGCDMKAWSYVQGFDANVFGEGRQKP